MIKNIFSVLFDDSDEPVLILDNYGFYYYTNKKFSETFIFLSKGENFIKSFQNKGIQILEWLESLQNKIEIEINNTRFIFGKKAFSIDNKKFYKINIIIPELVNEQRKLLASIVALISKTAPDNEFFYIFSYFPEPKYRFVTPNVKDITGYSPQDFYEDSFILNRNNTDEKSELKEYEIGMLDKSKDISERKVITYSIKDKNGNIKWLQDTCIVIDAHSRTVFGFVRDITDLKITQHTYLNLLENIPVPYIVINKEGLIVYANQFFFDFMKINDKNAFLKQRHSYKDFLFEKYYEKAEKRVKNIFNEKKPNNFIFYEIKNFSGEIFKVQVRSLPITYNNENCMLTTLLDVTLLEKYHEEKIRLEFLEKYKNELEEKLSIISKLNRELEIQKNRFDVLMNQSDFLIWILDDKFRFTYFNNNFKEKFFQNYNTNPELYKTGDECIKDEELKKVYRNFWYDNYKKVFQAKKIEIEKVDDILNSEYPVIRIINLFPLYDKNGKIVEIAGIARDISEKILSEKMLAKQMAEMKSIIENGPHYFWSVNKKNEITNFNKNYEKLFFYIYQKKPVLYSKLIRNEKQLNTGIEEIIKNYDIAFKGNQVAFDVKIKHYNGFEQFLSVYMMPIFSENNKVEEISIMALDITDKISVLNDLKENEQKLSITLKEKEILLKELHHRVKNNLQVISSILNIQSRYVNDINTKSVIDETKNRIKSMALVHENLYKSKGIDFLNLKIYFQDIFQNLINGFIESNSNIQFYFNSDDVFLSTELATPLGLILNELLTNSFKHGIPASVNEKFISVELTYQNNFVSLSVADSGPGFKKNPFLEPENIKTLGMILIRDLTYQLGGEIIIDNTSGYFKITIKFKHH